jgi:hypothetical protein
MSRTEAKPNAQARLQAALAKLPPRPWHVDLLPPSLYQARGYTMRPGDQADSMIIPQNGLEVGALRMANGGNVVEPWPESNSLIVSVPGVLNALADAINAAAELTDAE